MQIYSATVILYFPVTTGYVLIEFFENVDALCNLSQHDLCMSFDLNSASVQSNQYEEGRVKRNRRNGIFDERRMSGI